MGLLYWIPFSTAKRPGVKETGTSLGCYGLSRLRRYVVQGKGGVRKDVNMKRVRVVERLLEMGKHGVLGGAFCKSMEVDQRGMVCGEVSVGLYVRGPCKELGQRGCVGRLVS